MKKLHPVLAMFAALSIALFAPLATAQTAVPDDTTARVAQNLVNQVSAANFKAVAEHPALGANILTQAAASTAARMLNIAADNYAEVSAIRGAALSVALKSFQTMSAQESMALAKSMQADQASQIQQLMAALNAGGIGTKVMQTVPPITAAAPVTQ